jgi:tetratricopeptide (TPR) repeat protein
MTARYPLHLVPSESNRDRSSELLVTAAGPSAAPAGGFSAEVYFAAAELLLQGGHVDSALRAMDRGLKLKAPPPETQALHAWLLYRRDRSGAHVRPQVWDQLDRALARDEGCALAHYFKSVLLQRSGHLDEARRHLQRARTLDANQRVADRAIALLDDE